MKIDRPYAVETRVVNNPQGRFGNRPLVQTESIFIPLRGLPKAIVMPNAAKPSRGISPPIMDTLPFPLGISAWSDPRRHPGPFPSPPGISVGASLVGALPSVILANAGTPPPTPYQHVIPNPVKRSTPNYHYYENSPFRAYKSLPPRFPRRLEPALVNDGGWG